LIRPRKQLTRELREYIKEHPRKKSAQELTAEAETAVRLLKTGTRFDFIFLRRGEKAKEYNEVRRILETAEVVVE